MNLLEILKKNADNAKSYIDGLVSKKQDILTFDTAPTEGSQNPVTSDGIQKAIAAKTVDLSNYPTKDGTGATGNWSINAATATAATNDQYSNNIADSTHVLKPNTNYSIGDSAMSTYLPFGKYLECTTSGTTDNLSDIETILKTENITNTWTDTYVSGQSTTDFNTSHTLNINGTSYSVTRAPYSSFINIFSSGYDPDTNVFYDRTRNGITISIRLTDTITESMFEESGVFYDYFKNIKLKVKDQNNNELVYDFSYCGPSVVSSTIDIGLVIFDAGFTDKQYFNSSNESTITIDFIDTIMNIGTAKFKKILLPTRIVTNDIDNNINDENAVINGPYFKDKTDEIYTYIHNTADSFISKCSEDSIRTLWVSLKYYYQQIQNYSKITSLPEENANYIIDVLPGVVSVAYMLRGCSSLTSVDTSKWNTSNVTDMDYMFSGCSSLTSLDISKFDTFNVTSMLRMFSGCSSLTSLNISGFDTYNVQDMSYMFDGCSKLTTITGIINMKSCTRYRCTDMFRDCTKLTGVKIKNPPSGFDGAGLSSSQYTIVS